MITEEEETDPLLSEETDSESLTQEEPSLDLDVAEEKNEEASKAFGCSHSPLWGFWGMIGVLFYPRRR